MLKEQDNIDDNDCTDTLPNEYSCDPIDIGSLFTPFHEDSALDIAIPHLPRQWHGKRNERKQSQNDVVVRCAGLEIVPPEVLANRLTIGLLDLSQNRFMHFPNEILALSQLRILYLEDNEIEDIPANIEQLSQLEVLSLSCNNLRTIEPCLARLVSLRALLLNENRLTNWPALLCTGLRNLERLSLEGNSDIAGIPHSFAQMERLTEFSFDWFHYLQRKNNLSSSQSNGTQYIPELRQLCQRSLSNLLEANQSRTCTGMLPLSREHCTFMEFLEWFTKGTSNEQPPKLLQGSKTPLHFAAMWGHVAVVQELLSSSCDFDLNALDEDQSTALCCALRYNQLEVALVLARSEKIEAMTVLPKHGTTLHLALMKGMFNIAELILSKAEVVPDIADAYGNTLLHCVFAKFSLNPSQAGHIVGLLVDKHHCKTNRLNNSGLSPLHCAAKKVQIYAIKHAIIHNENHKHDIAKQFSFSIQGGKYGFTVLHYVALYCDIDTVLSCLQYPEVDVLALDGYGRTARELVRNTSVGKLLLRREKELIKLNRRLQHRTGYSTPNLDSAQTFRKDHTATLIETLEKPQDDQDACELDAEDVMTPIHIKRQAYTSPLMFDTFHRLTLGSAELSKQCPTDEGLPGTSLDLQDASNLSTFCKRHTFRANGGNFDREDPPISTREGTLMTPGDPCVLSPTKDSPKELSLPDV